MSMIVSRHNNGGLKCIFMLSLMRVLCFVSSNLGIWTIESVRVEWLMSYDSSETYTFGSGSLKLHHNFVHKLNCLRLCMKCFLFG